MKRARVGYHQLLLDRYLLGKSFLNADVDEEVVMELLLYVDEEVVLDLLLI
jgi:hypothetical protein